MDHLLKVETKQVEEGYVLTNVGDADTPLLSKGTLEPGSYGTFTAVGGMTLRVTGEGRLHVGLPKTDEVKSLAKGDTLRLEPGTEYDFNVMKATAFVATYDLPTA